MPLRKASGTCGPLANALEAHNMPSQSVAQALLSAAAGLRETGQVISTAAVVRASDVSFSLAGRAAVDLVLTLCGLSILCATLWLAFCAQPWKPASLVVRQKLAFQSVAWCCLGMFSAIFYSAHLALYLAFGPLAADFSISQTLLCLAFFSLWLGTSQIVLRRLDVSDLVLDTQRAATAEMSRRYEPVRHMFYIAALAVALTTLIVFQSLLSATAELSSTLQNVWDTLKALPLPTDLLSPTTVRLGQSMLDGMNTALATALDSVAATDAHLALSRMALALLMLPFLALVDLLALRRLQASIKHAEEVEALRTSRAETNRLLRLPSISRTVSFQWNENPPPVPASATLWPEDVPLVRNGLSSLQQESDLLRLPAEALLRAPTNASAVTASSKYSVASAPRSALSMKRAHTAHTTWSHTSIDWPPSPSVSTLQSLRQRRLVSGSVLCGVVIMYAMMELVAAEVRGGARLIPLAVVGVVLAATQITALIAALLDARRRPKVAVREKVVETFGLAV